MTFSTPTRAAGLPLLAIALVGLAGCQSGSDTGTVTGKVTLDGQPVASGIVTVLAKCGGTPVTAIISPDGTYRVEKVPAGEILVGVVSMSGDAGAVWEDLKKRGQGGRPPPPVPRPVNLLPKRYADPGSSGLSVTVKGATVFDLALRK
jgi:hypothetical protein